MVNTHLMDLRARSLPGGGRQDCISSFRFRWKMNPQQDALLRGLTHKELRYVLANFNAEQALEDVIEEAKTYEPEEQTTMTAIPDYKGIAACSRFGRLELIDPVADAAIFGDANLTFALKLAKHRKVLGHVGRLVATTFEELDTLRERYKEIDESIATLEDFFAEVYHGVDCTRISLDERFEEMISSLGAVYYNFPHSGSVQGSYID
eukprot:1999070-Amphidinium_carterae.1